MAIDDTLLVKSPDAVQLEDIDHNKIHWLRGDPNTPRLNVFIIYQKEEGLRRCHYESFPLYADINFIVFLSSGKIEPIGEGYFRGDMLLDFLGQAYAWERNPVAKEVEMHKSDQLDIVFVPHPVYGTIGMDGARTIILANYFTYHLQNPVALKNLRKTFNPS